jgi:tetratricopeptide (TPR) repeat protein
MACPLISSSFRCAVRTLVVLLASAGTADASLQEHPFDPPILLSVPTLRGLLDRNPPKFEGPKLEPFNFDGLLGPRPATIAKPGPELPLTTTLAPDLQAEFVAYVRKFEAAQAAKAQVPDRIDYAVVLVRRGRYTDAIETLLAIEERYPGVYETAANLGTAYELVGNVEEAIVWIARGMERKINSPRETEWLRLAILRAKLKLRDDASWLEEHTVLDGVADRSTEDILQAIDSQLEERLHFVQPVDAVVCDLFYQAALRVAGENSDERRAHYLRESQRFGQWRKAEIAALRKN